MTHRLLRLPEVLSRFPRGRSSFYADISRGLFVPPVACGARCSAWPEREVNEIINARIAGTSDDELRKLVKKLEADRKAAPGIDARKAG